MWSKLRCCLLSATVKIVGLIDGLLSKLVPLYRARITKSTTDTTGFRDLPIELYRVIGKQGLAPGKVFPFQRPGPNGRFPDTRRRNHPGFAPPVISLLSLNYNMWASVWDILLGQNTIVIGPGDYQDTAQWIEYLPDHLWPLIRSMELILTWDDLYGYKGSTWFTVYDDLLQISNAATLTSKDVTAAVHERFGHEVGMTWHKKFLAIYCLKLKNLTLDFRHAECESGCCTPELQMNFARNIRLLHGRPDHFQVLAANPKIARKIKKVATIALNS